MSSILLFYPFALGRQVLSFLQLFFSSLVAHLYLNNDQIGCIQWKQHFAPIPFDRFYTSNKNALLFQDYPLNLALFLLELAAGNFYGIPFSYRNISCPILCPEFLGKMSGQHLLLDMKWSIIAVLSLLPHLRAPLPACGKVWYGHS